MKAFVIILLILLFAGCAITGTAAIKMNHDLDAANYSIEAYKSMVKQQHSEIVQLEKELGR